jgi:hypothetical protein
MHSVRALQRLTEGTVVMTKGFKDEKELWKYQKKFLPPTFQRYELMTPAGHPDVKGSIAGRIVYIENKVGEEKTAKARRKKLQASQIEYLSWLYDCNQEVYVCFGDPSRKVVSFYRWPDLENRLDYMPGWTGPY